MNTERSPSPSRVGILIVLVMIRWVAGILEPFGLAGLSEAAALLVLTVLAAMFLMNPRVARAPMIALSGFLAWCFTALVSLTATPVAEVADAVELLALLGLYGLFLNQLWLGAANLLQIRPVAIFFQAFIAAGCAMAVAQVVGETGLSDPAMSQVRAIGSDVHPVSFGIQLVAALLGLRVAIRKSGQGIGTGTALVFLAGGVALYLTFARTAWAMALVALAYAALAGRIRPARLIVLAAILVAVLSNSRFADLSSLPYFLEQFDRGNIVFDPRFVDNSVSWRIVNWGYGLDQAMQRPWLGHGPGQSAAASTFDLEMHNIFLEVFFELGVFGLISFLLLVWGLVRLHRTLPKTTEADRAGARLANGFGLALLAAATLSTSLVDQLMSVLFYFLLLFSAKVPARTPEAATRGAAALPSQTARGNLPASSFHGVAE